MKLNKLYMAISLAVLASNAMADPNEITEPEFEWDTYAYLEAAKPVYQVTSKTASGTVPTPTYTTEQKLSKGSVGIGAAKIQTYMRATGLGATVAVLDTGLNTAHAEFSGRIDTRGYNFTNNSSNVTDGHGHGTHVAGIIGAAADGKGMQGVAPEVKILPIKVFADNGSGSAATVLTGLKYSIGKANIANLSLGWTSDYGVTDMKTAVAGGMLIVAAAGNVGGANPIWPARYAKEAWANGQIIAVGAVDDKNVITSWSNKAGDTKNFYLVAPGSSIYSTYKGTSTAYATMSGTSMAAPSVSGAAAIISSYWPSMAARDIASLLFVTATDLGTPGIDAIYGRGMVNLEKAMMPQGVLRTPAVNSVVYPYRTNYMPGVGYGTAIVRKASTGALSAVSLDEFNRDYTVDMGSAISFEATSPLSGMFGVTDSHIRTIATNENGSKFQMTFAEHDDMSKLGLVSTEPVKSGVVGFHMQTEFNGKNLSIGSNGYANKFFGLVDTPFENVGLLSKDSLANPYFGLVAGQSHLALGFSADNGVKVKYGLMSGSNITQYSGLTSDSATTGQVGVAEVSKNWGNGVLALAGGVVKEGNAFLGGYGEGGLGINSAPSTTFLSLAGAFKVSPKTWVAGTLAGGVTNGFSNSASLISDVSTTTTLAASLGLVRKDAFKTNDNLTVSMSMPMKVVSGSMTYTAASSINEDGSANMDSVQFGLNPGATEVDFEFGYQTPIAKNSALAVSAVYRMNPGHNSEAAPDAGLGFKYQATF